jgi:hypothetical protein
LEDLEELLCWGSVIGLKIFYRENRVFLYLILSEHYPAPEQLDGMRPALIDHPEFVMRTHGLNEMYCDEIPLVRPSNLLDRLSFLLLPRQNFAPER